MRDRTSLYRTVRARVLALACAAVALAVPGRALAQYTAPRLTSLAIGERYHVELAGTIWNPSLFGTISSEQFGLPADSLDFTTDLGFEQTRFKDFRVVLRPARKHKFRAQYTPISYLGESVLSRTIVFNGISFDASLPISSQVDWKVWRIGYEYDMVYRDRGFVGVLFETRVTQYAATLTAPGRAEFTSARAPLPAIGLVARAYVVPSVALNFEVSGFRVPDIDPKYQANYFDWDIHGTVNLTNNVGVEVGWRKMTTFLKIDHDQADLRFQGMWFGAAVRY